MITNIFKIQSLVFIFCFYFSCKEQSYTEKLEFVPTFLGTPIENERYNYVIPNDSSVDFEYWIDNKNNKAGYVINKDTIQTMVVERETFKLYKLNYNQHIYLGIIATIHSYGKESYYYYELLDIESKPISYKNIIKDKYDISFIKLLLKK
jgi:hypothetical protein